MVRRFLVAAQLVVLSPLCAQADDDQILKAVTFYASFDEKIQADFGKGDRTVSTRFDKTGKKGEYEFQPGFDTAKFRIAKGKGVSGGALQATDVLPRRGRMFFPVKGNLAYRKTGWSGSVSVWINTNPDKMLKTKYCDPIQITQKGASNGGIWFDFTPDKPRDMRMGIFTDLKPREKPAGGSKAPLIVVKDVGFRSGDWHHVVLTWKNLDTGKPNAVATLYVDGKRIGELANRRISMKWEVDRAGVYFAVNYIGLLDELVLFDRALTSLEIRSLYNKPGAVSALIKQ